MNPTKLSRSVIKFISFNAKPTILRTEFIILKGPGDDGGVRNGADGEPPLPLPPGGERLPAMMAEATARGEVGEAAAACSSL